MEQFKEIMFLVASLIGAAVMFVVACAIAVVGGVFLFINRHMWPIAFMAVGFTAIYYFA